MRRIRTTPAIALLVAAAAILPSACSPVTLASVAASGVSMMATGKGLAEHALSGIRREDCAMSHLFDGAGLCVPYEAADVVAGAPVALAMTPAEEDLSVDVFPAVTDNVGMDVASGPEFVRETATPQVPPTASYAPENDPVWQYMMGRVRDGFADAHWPGPAASPVEVAEATQ